MKLCIVGESLVGKSTLHNVLTDGVFKRETSFFSGFGTFLIEDPNLDYLADVYNSRKKTPLHVEVYDFDGFGKLWKEDKKGQLRNYLTDFEALICVISSANQIDLIDSFVSLEYKLYLTDLEFVSSRIESLKKERIKKKVNEDEIAVLEKIEKWLSQEKPVYSLELSESERNLIKGYIFLSNLPQIFVVNVEESDLNKPLPEELVSKMEDRNSPYFVTSLKAEEELIGLSPSEKKEILEGFGVKEDVKSSISRVLKDVIGVTIFYTAGDTEARAWYVRKGATAKEAAGRIHSDLERGFIRAEVIHIDDFKKAGSEKKAKEMGLYRLEGKDYIVKDGDILLIRFSV